MNMMKKNIIWIALAAAVLAGCAKAPSKGLNEDSKAYLESWIKIFHPDAQKTPMGAYILSDVPGSGPAIGSEDVSPYVCVNYTIKSLDGTVKSTNSMAMSQQIGTYDKNNFYGPKIWSRPDYGVYAGIEEALSTMKLFGRRTVMIPGWLLSSKKYSSAEEYFKKGSGTEAIYEIEPVEIIKDIVQWEIDSISLYMVRNYDNITPADSIKRGFFYVRTGEPADTCGFHKDTTIYINYTGRLLNGTVFDTTIKDTAKFYGIYDPTKTYEPQRVLAKPEFEETSMGESGSSIITGFAYTIYQMHSFEKGTGVFHSAYGYKSSGSGENIPPYSPLRFDIEVVGQQ